MNFYKHHLGDYAQATGHLSFVEDAAYSRLIRKYYAEERPIPADLKAAQRLVGARTKEEKEAVETVLGEFFVLGDDGWRNKRCDEELSAANAQADTNRRIAEEREAKRRAKKAEEALNDPSNASSTNRGDEESTKRETNRSTNRQPSQTPDSRLQTPDKETRGEVAPVSPRASRLPSDWTLPDDWRDWARRERADLDPDRVAAKFRDHWAAKPGKAGTKLDWLATWRNWVREERSSPALRSASEPAWRTEQRERMQQAAPYAVANRPTQQRHLHPDDDEATDVFPLTRPIA